MNRHIAYCGLNCEGCPIYLATRETDPELQEDMRKSIAELCFDEYGMTLQPEEITDCDGCRSVNGRLFSGCRNCEIRKCAMEKLLDNCGLCLEFSCEKLENFFIRDPGAKHQLQRVRGAHML